MTRRRPPTLRIIGYDRLAADWSLARRIFRDFFPCEKDGFAECMVCPHWVTCSRDIAGIRDLITNDRLEERRETGEILVKLTVMVRELKKRGKDV